MAKCTTTWNKGKDVSLTDDYVKDLTVADIDTRTLLESILLELRIANAYTSSSLDIEITEEDLQ